jgi:hypothetical protein
MKIVIDQAKKTARASRDTQAAPQKQGPRTTSMKRPSIQYGSQQKKMKTAMSSFGDIPLIEAEKYGTLNEFALFDTVRFMLSMVPLAQLAGEACKNFHLLPCFSHFLLSDP